MPGRWERDFLTGPKSSYITTLVERHTSYVMLIKVMSQDMQTVVSALIKQSRKLPRELRKSLTQGRGKELMNHRQFSLATNIDVYFCDPRSPWQRGSNENANSLLRQCFPKGIDLSVYSQVQLNKVARQLNQRPRKSWVSKLQQNSLTPVLHRSVEVAMEKRTLIAAPAHGRS